jgi:hypothetical protein
VDILAFDGTDSLSPQALAPWWDWLSMSGMAFVLTIFLAERVHKVEFRRHGLLGVVYALAAIAGFLALGGYGILAYMAAVDIAEDMKSQTVNQVLFWSLVGGFVASIVMALVRRYLTMVVTMLTTSVVCFALFLWLQTSVALFQ